MQALMRAWRPLSRHARLMHTGKHIVAQGPNELLLYYTNIFVPVRVYNRRFCRFMVQQWYNDFDASVAASFPEDLGVSIVATEPRPTEGAAFVKIACADRDRAADIAAGGFARRWLLFSHKVTGFEVLGVPSLTQTPPPLSRSVQVSPPLDATSLDELMHVYGRITDVSSGCVKFSSHSAALTARQCTNRSVFRGQDLAVVLERTPTIPARFGSWFTNHPRFSIPLLLFVLIGLVTSVFDPIREYSIYSKIQGATLLSRLTAYTRRYLSSSFLCNTAHANTGHMHQLNRLANSCEQLRLYIEEAEPTFTVVYGPHGSGKNTIVDSQVQQESQYVLEIDAGKLKNSQGDEQRLWMLAKMLGYWPAFPWANQIARLVDLEVKALTSQPAGISETTEQQCLRMLEKARRALRRLALRSKKDPSQSDEAYLEANASSRPIIVIRDYSSGEQLPELLVKWTSELIANNIARVVLVTRDATFERILGSVLPNHPPRVIAVEDASAAEARDFVLNKLSASATSPEARHACAAFAKLDPAFIRPLGGRFTDLQMYARRLVNGEMPDVALRNQIDQAAQSVSLRYLQARDAAWTPEQAWTLINVLGAAADADGGWTSVPGCVALAAAFKGANTQAVLEALEAQEMISVRSRGGHIISVKASRPLFLAAFRALANDGLTAADMNTRVYTQQVKRETAQISTYETELGLLAQAPARSREVGDRQSYLCTKLGASQKRVSELEALIKQQTDILTQIGKTETSLAAYGSRRQ